VLHPEGTHGFEDFGKEGGGRVRVHVDSAHGSILACGVAWAGKRLNTDLHDDTDQEQATARANAGVLPLRLALLAQGPNDRVLRKVGSL
jgi:hypothetical protein